MAIDTHHQDDPRLRADASHTDHLASNLDEPEPLQQVSAIRLEGLSVRTQDRDEALFDGVSLVAFEQLVERNDEGWLAHDPGLTVDLLGELGEGLHAVTGTHLRLTPCRVPSARFGWVCALISGSTWSTSTWAYHTSRLVMSANERIVVRYSRTPVNTASRRSLSVKPSSRPSDLQAGRQALHVPLPRADRGLIEVVDVEDQLAARVSRTSRSSTGGRHRRAGRPARRSAWSKVRGHDQRRAAVEGERRDPHASVTDRDELGDPLLRLLLQEVDRVEAHVGSELRVALAWYLLPRSFPSCLAFLAAEGAPPSRMRGGSSVDRSSEPGSRHRHLHPGRYGVWDRQCVLRVHDDAFPQGRPRCHRASQGAVCRSLRLWLHGSFYRSCSLKSIPRGR